MFYTNFEKNNTIEIIGTLILSNKAITRQKEDGITHGYIDGSPKRSKNNSNCHMHNNIDKKDATKGKNK